jgi:hypothetical protein
MVKLIEMKCDCGPRYNWAKAETLWVPELGLLNLTGPIDFGFAVSFESKVNEKHASVEITTGLVKVYIYD